MSFRKLAIRRLAGALGLLLALSLALVPASALGDAPPQMSHVFYGTVTIEGEAASVGTVITASVAELEYTYTIEVVGEYGYNPAETFYIPAEGVEEGDPIEFYISGAQAELYDVDADETLDSYPFEIGGATNLNLSIGEAVTLTADAGGPYSGTEGVSIALSGFASGGTSPYNYAWDLDNDGEYDDADVSSPSNTWETAGTYTIGLQVTDGADGEATDTATVTVIAADGFDPYEYDEDGDDDISKEEAQNACSDYLAGTISKDDALKVVKLYFL